MRNGSAGGTGCPFRRANAPPLARLLVVVTLAAVPPVVISVAIGSQAAAQPAWEPSVALEDSIESMQARAEALRREGRYGEALDALRGQLRFLQERPRECELYIDGTRLTIATLEKVLTLPEEVRGELAKAYQLETAIDEQEQKGLQTEAVRLSELQLQIFQRYLGPASWDQVSRTSFLARRLKYLGDYSAAEVRYREGLAMYRELLGREHHYVAQTLMELSWLVSDQGRSLEAEQLARESLAIHRKLYGEEHPYVAYSMMTLALAYMRGGKHAEAEPLMWRALVIRRKAKVSIGLIEQSMHNLAALLANQGDDARAEAIFRDLLEIRLARLGEVHDAVAANLSQLGRILCRKNRLDEAEEMLIRCVKINRALSKGKDHPELARSMATLARVYEAKQDYAEAERLLREALMMSRRVLGERHPDVGLILAHLGRVLLLRGRAADAEQCLRTAVELMESGLGHEHPNVCMGLDRLGQALLARNRLVEAEVVFDRASEIFDGARQRAGRGFARANFLESPHGHLAATRLLLGKTVEAWPATERAHGRALGDLLLASDERFLDAAEATREDSLRRCLDEIGDQLEVLERAARGDAGADVLRKLEETRDRLTSTEAVWSEFQREIGYRHPVTEGQAYDLQRVQQVLADDCAVIGWLYEEIGRGSPAAWGYVIRKVGPVRWVRLGASGGSARTGLRTETARVFREELSAAGSWPLRVTAVDDVLTDGGVLYEDWVAPLVPELEGVTHLIVIPFGPMSGIPLEALIDARAGVYLGDRFTVSYVPSATLYTWLREHVRGPRPSPAWKALLIGDPTFAQRGAEESLAQGIADVPDGHDRESSTAGGAFRSAEVGDRLARVSLPRLRHAREEIQQVAAVMPGAEVLLGPQACEPTLVGWAASGRLRGFDVIHLATHALIDDAAPERSALVLSQTDLPDPLEAALAGGRIYDGYLTVREIVREWRLDAELVTLSACQTALGKNTPGEGYIGLASGFLQAGARSLLVSLWKVDDEATALLMGRFYENLCASGTGDRRAVGSPVMPKAAALQEAKHWLRTYADSQNRHPFAHPAYWSGFILIGDPD